ncbi:Gfo/Idh/MocA family protein [Parvibium lacunae]|uniref:Gfo/Idh/MocA family protein n=1 Tax=Parvibium lacunae TaxID=1888893 RepID=UPI00131480E5|nr:Gfo/Idh/MocA family oxidoreductase [Parvibium lacunae]
MISFANARCLVVGYGSIGMRHSRILGELGCNVSVMSRRVDAVDSIVSYDNISDALQSQQPNYVVIANETAQHHPTLEQLIELEYQGAVLIEKPLFNVPQRIPENQFSDLRVAYNLRFHPVVLALKSALANQKILSVHSYVGQYLPDWRPGTDYRQSYSAHAKSGGGVLLDLSHDLDYLSWMFGDWLKVTALGGQLSKLELSSDDIFSMLITYAECPIASVQLNYLDRLGRRRIIINTLDHTYEADLIQNKIVIDKDEEYFIVERDDTYRAMHVAMLLNQENFTCTAQEALKTLQLIDAARQCADATKWVGVV